MVMVNVFFRDYKGKGSKVVFFSRTFVSILASYVFKTKINKGQEGTHCKHVQQLNGQDRFG